MSNVMKIVRERGITVKKGYEAMWVQNCKAREAERKCLYSLEEENESYTIRIRNIGGKLLEI